MQTFKTGGRQQSERDVLVSIGRILDEIKRLGIPFSGGSISVPGVSTEVKQDTTITALGLLAKLTDTQPVSASSLPLPVGAATQATLAALLTELQLKANLSESQPISLPTGTETPSLTSVTSSGTIAAGAKSVSILNLGTSDGAVLGTTLPPGISVSFKASEGKTLTAIAYVATASSELLISTTV